MLGLIEIWRGILEMVRLVCLVGGFIGLIRFSVMGLVYSENMGLMSQSRCEFHHRAYVA